jgi:asparagine synthase (glutamine-hydrolysing)
MVKIPIYRQAFIGYWGSTIDDRVRQKFDLAIDGWEVSPAIIAPEYIQVGHNIPWQIYHWHGDLEREDNRITIGLSGGGIDRDIWAKIDDNSLQLGRDIYGRSRCYYLVGDGGVWFGSHLDLIRRTVEEIEWDAAGIYGYSCCSYLPLDLTPIVGIKSLEAGRSIDFQIDALGGININYHHLGIDWHQIEPQITDEKFAIDRLQELLIQAIERQIIDLDKQTEVGVFLSGGLDSAIVAALLVKVGLKPIAYSLDFGEYGISEYAYAEMVARHLNIPIVRVDARPDRIKTALLPTISALDLPYGDGVTVPLYLLGQSAARSVEIIFNGEGGDQLFGGWTNKPLIAASIYQSHTDFADRYLQTFHRLWGYERLVFRSQFIDLIEEINSHDWIHHAIDPQFTNSIVHLLRRANLMLKGAGNIQPRATNLAAIHGLKVRSIFTDPDLTDFSFQLTGELTLKASCEKYILKQAVTDWLPPEIVWRSKRGMGVPLTSWCLTPFWRDLGCWLNPERLAAGGIWRSDLATRIVSGNLGGGIQGRRIGEILWSIICWELWVDRDCDRSPKLSWQHPFWLPPQLGRLWLKMSEQSSKI